jgi:hypothetical protein
MPATWARPSEYTLVGGGMGDLRELSFSALDASAWQSLVGPVISRNGSTKLSDALLEQFTDSADPTGSEWNKPIIPGVYSPSETLEAEIVLPGHSRIASRVFLGFKANRWGSHIRDIIRRDLDEYENTPAAGRLQDKWLEVWGGYTQKYFGRHDRAGAAELLSTRMKPVAAGRKPRKPKTSYTDNFDRADSSTLGAGWTLYTSIAAAYGISSNRAIGGKAATWGSNAIESVRFDSDVSSIDHWTTLIMYDYVAVYSGDTWSGPSCRFSASAHTSYYYAQITRPSAGNNRLDKVVAGTMTNLGGAGAANADGDLLQVSATGSSLVGKKNNVTQITVTDTAISSGTRGGIAYRSANYGVRPTYDNWSINDGITGGSVGPVLGHASKTIGGRLFGGSVLT